MDIGTLTGEVNIEDNLSETMDRMGDTVSKFALSFGKSFGATGLAVAEAGIAITTAIVGISAAIGALAKQGSEVNQVASSLDGLTGSSEKSTDIIEKMAAGTLHTVDNFTLMKDASKLLSTHTLKNADDFGTLTQAATVLANKGLGNTEGNVQKLSQALITGRTKTIQSMVGFIDATAAQQDYAASMDRSRSSLTKHEQLVAVQIAVMERLKNTVKSSGEQYRNFSDDIKAAHTWFTNLGISLSQAVDKSPAVSKALQDIEDVLKSAFGESTQKIIDGVMWAINGFAEGVSATIEWVKKLSKDGGEMNYAMAAMWDILKSVWSIITSVWQVFVPLVEIIWKLYEPVRILYTIALVQLAVQLHLIAAVAAVVADAIKWLLNKIIEFMDAVKNHIPFLNELADALAWIKEKATGTKAAIDDHKTATQQATDATADFSGPLQQTAEELAAQEDEATRAAKAMDDHAKAVEKADKKIADYGKTIVPLTEVEKARVAELHKMGLNTADIAAKTDLSEVSISNYTETLKKNKSASEAHTKAVNDAVTALTAGSKASNITAEAFSKLTQKQLDSEETMRNLIPVLTKLYKEQGNLTDGQRDALLASISYREAMKVVDEQLIESSGLTEDYIKEQLAMGRSLDEIAALFNVSAQAISDYVKKQDALYASNLKVADSWREYNKTVAANDDDRLQNQLDDISAWYNASYKAIKDDSVNHTEAWDQLAPLNALFWAKMVKAREDTEKAADTRMRALTDAYTDFVESQSMTSTDYQVQQIWREVENQRLADIAAGKYSQDADVERMRLANARTDALYIDNAALVENSSLTYQQMADKAATTYDAMAAQPDIFSKAAIKAQAQVYWDLQHKADGMVDTYGKAMTTIGGMFKEFGDLIGGSTGKAISGLSGITDMLKTASAQQHLIGREGGDKAGQELGGKFGMVSTLFDSNAEMSDRVGAAQAITENTISGIQDMKKGMDQRGRGNRALAGAAAGAKIGAVGGIYGMAIGAAAGAVIGLAKGDPAWAKATDEVARDTGLKISDEMGKTIATSAKTLGGRDVAIVENLAGIIKDAGGLTEKNIEGVQGKLRDVFSYIETGQLKVADGTKILDENWAQFAAAGTSASGVLNKGLTEIIGLARDFGVESKAMTDYLGAQGTESATNFGNSLAIGANALLKQQDILDQLGTAGPEDIRALNEELQTQQGIIDATTIKTQEGADAMSAAVAADFEAMLNSGMSFSDAVVAITPSISALQVQMEAAGISGSDVFTLLESQVALYSDAIAGPALASVDSLTKGIVNLGNMGQLNQETFAGLADQIGVTFDSLVRQGYDGNTVMIGMKDSIQKVWEEQQQFGFVVDDSTQALIDQAVEQGLVGETHKSTTDQMLDASNRMVDVLEAMANTMGVVLPQQASKGARGVQTALDGIHAPALTVEVGYHDPGYHSQELPEGNEASHASTGGYVSSTGVQYLASGGEVFQPQGTDTVPAMLTPGERVLSVDQNNQYEQNITGPSNQEVVDSINGLRQDLNGKMPRALARALHTGLVGLRTAS